MANATAITATAAYYPERNGVLVAGTVTNNGVAAVGINVIVTGDWGQSTAVKSTYKGHFGAGLAASTNVRGRIVTCEVTYLVKCTTVVT